MRVCGSWVLLCMVAGRRSARRCSLQSVPATGHARQAADVGHGRAPGAHERRFSVSAGVCVRQANARRYVRLHDAIRCFHQQITHLNKNNPFLFPYREGSYIAILPLSCPKCAWGRNWHPGVDYSSSTGMPGFTGPSPSTSLDKATVIHLLMLAGAGARASCLHLNHAYANTAPQARQTMVRG